MTRISMRNRLLWLVLPVLLVAIGIASGCSSSSPTATPAPTATTAPATTVPPTATQPTATTASEPTATPSGSGQTGNADVPFTTSASVSLTGAGSSFAYPLYSKWAAEWKTKNSGVQVNYQSVGSGAGIQQVISKTVNFGGTDGPMTSDQQSQAGSLVLHIPTAMGGVVPTYNLPGNPQLKFSPDVLADIYLGKITKWNDSRIAADNPGVSLPNLDIAVVHRSDGSGTSFIWTSYLSSVSSDWKSQVGASTAVNWPAGIGGKGNEGVSALVSQTQGAIGYVELAYAQQNKLPVPEIKNKAGNFVPPTQQTVSNAAAGMIAAGQFPANLQAVVVNAAGAQSYPIAGFTWMMIYKNLSVVPNMTMAQAQELIRFVAWGVSQSGGQQYETALGYAPLAPSVSQKAIDALKTITFNGQNVYQTLVP